ncbi:MAG TPA: PDDEXK nuclease domain-containing protein, partial [Chitinophagaceae bacterium]
MRGRKRNIYTDVKAILELARNNAVRSVNFSMVMAYWKIGERIEEEILKGKRATYGEQLIDRLSKRLTKEFGRGFTVTNLKYMRLFYNAFPIGHAVRDQFKQQGKVLRPELSWTHYRSLMAVENPEARQYYMNEAAENTWSTRVLERQINSFYYERLLSSKNKKPLKSLSKKLAKDDKPNIFDFIKDPYVLEFLQLKPSATLYEKELETELLNKLQQFLLEMGKGFSFVER